MVFCCKSVAVVAIKVYGDENPALTAVVTGTVNGDTINYTPNYCSQFSNVLGYPIDVTLGDNLTIVLFQLMVF
jgi:hypothetical protein